MKILDANKRLEFLKVRKNIQLKLYIDNNLVINDKLVNSDTGIRCGIYNVDIHRYSIVFFAAKNTIVVSCITSQLKKFIGYKTRLKIIK